MIAMSGCGLVWVEKIEITRYIQRERLSLVSKNEKVSNKGNYFLTLYVILYFNEMP